MVVTVIDDRTAYSNFSSYAAMVYEYERIRDDPVKCKEFLDKNNTISDWPIIGHARHAPHMIIGYCFNCENEVRKFSGWTLKTRSFPWGPEDNYRAESYLHCRHCTNHTPGWQLDQLSVWDVIRTVFCL